MRKTITVAVRAHVAATALALAGLVSLESACSKNTEGTTSPPESTAAAASTLAMAAATAAPTETVATPASSSTADAVSSAPPSAHAGASGSAAADAAPSGSAAAPKTFDCGAKGQKPCPLQGWMKSVMSSASSSGDGDKLAQALAYVAGRAPPGFGNWSSIASAGAAKAKAGDIDGAKKACKQCHDAYKQKYKTTMRDRPF